MAEPTKRCPLCGEEILAVAVRCKHCQADLREPEFDRGAALVPSRPAGPPVPVAGADRELEQRFLAFAYETREPLTPAAVAYGLKVSIREAEELLEDMAARDVLTREVTDEGLVRFELPGRPGRSGGLARRPSPGTLAPASSSAIAGLLLNLVLPGAGSIVAGRTKEGVLQLLLLAIGLPLCFVVVGIPVVIGTWAWGVSTSMRALREETDG